MAILPEKNLLDGTKDPSTTTGEFHLAMGNLRQFIADLPGVQEKYQAEAIGNADALTASFVQPIVIPRHGMRVQIRATTANTTTAPTFKADQTSALPIVKGNDQPLQAGEHECAVWKNDPWRIRYDCRGTVYWLPDGTWHEITETGRLPPEGALTQPPSPTLGQIRSTRLAELKAAFDRARKEARYRSSCGFDVDADETAQLNVSGLIATLETEGEKTVSSRDAGNTFHEVTAIQLITLQRKIVAYRQALYARKWALEKAIGEADTVEAVEAIELSLDVSA